MNRDKSFENLKRAGWDAKKSVDTNAIVDAFCRGVSSTPIRGVLLRGCCGSGKTMALESLYGIGRVCYSVVYALYSRDSIEGLLPIDHDSPFNRARGIVVLDDLGTSVQMPFKDSPFAPVDEYVSLKYRSWKQGTGGGIAVSTNLTIAQLRGLYSDRTISRIMEMTIYVDLKSGDNRPRG